jgi:hypothetical protein
VTCSHIISGERQIEHSVIFPISSSVGQVMGFLDNEGGDLCCKVTIYWKQDRMPRRVSFAGVVTLLDQILFVQTNVTVVLLVLDIREVALSYIASILERSTTNSSMKLLFRIKWTATMAFPA